MNTRELKSVVIESMPATRGDKILAGFTIVISILLIEAILSAGTQAISQAVLEWCSADLLGSAKTSLGLMIAVAGLFIVADIAVLIKLVSRKLVVRSKPARSAELTPAFGGVLA